MGRRDGTRRCRRDFRVKLEEARISDKWLSDKGHKTGICVNLDIQFTAVSRAEKQSFPFIPDQAQIQFWATS